MRLRPLPAIMRDGAQSGAARTQAPSGASRFASIAAHRIAWASVALFAGEMTANLMGVGTRSEFGRFA